MWSYFLPSSQGLEFYHLVISAAKAAFDLHSPNKPVIVDK